MSARLLLIVLVIASFGCAGNSRWESTRRPDELDAAALLASDTHGLRRDIRPDEMPEVPVRTRLRPCCAFGSGLRVRVGLLKIPGLSIGNIRSPRSIGHHQYDAGRFVQDVSEGSERNGLVYSCRGGFIDIAHVRDYADWTLFLAAQIGRHLETGGAIQLPTDEGGERRFVLQPIDAEFVRVVGRRELAASLAVWGGFQLSIWHEIATWYGWASYSTFSERASAFSPEDLYSNLLGAKIAGAIISGGNDLSEEIFDLAVDAWLDQSLGFLGAVSADVGEAAMELVDQVWWNSDARLPDANLVLRRSLEIGGRIEPWLVPTGRRDSNSADVLNQTCTSKPEPHALRNPRRLPGLHFEDVLRLETKLFGEFATKSAFEEFGPIVSNGDFPALIEQVRAEMKSEFGSSADSPGSN